MDNDGDLDLVVFDMEGNHLRYYRNPRNPSGDPKQQSQWSYQEIGSITSADAHNIFVDDVNNDGRLDVFIKGQYGGSGDAEIWIQNSPTSFTRTSLAGSSGGEGNCIGDIDNDGDLDLITSISSSPYVRWFENNGSGGGWTPHNGPNTGNGDLCLRVADINNDFRNELIVSHSEGCGNVSFFHASDPKSGPWTEKPVYSTSSCGWHSLQVGDINNDGKPDIMSAQMHGLVMAFYNPGADALGAWASDQVATTGLHTAVLADVDRNGSLDIVGCNYDGDSPVGMKYYKNGSVPLVVNNWTYKEIANSAQGNGNIQNFGYALYDINRDGKTDLISGNSWWENPGGDMTGTWSRTTITSSYICVAAFNVDGDDYADVIALSTDGTQLFWFEATVADGSAWTLRKNFGSVPPTTEGGYGGSQGQRVADIEKGGRLEFLIGTSDGSGGSNAGVYYFVIPTDPVNGTWVKKRACGPSQDESFSVVDIDRDGKLDIAYYAWNGSRGGDIYWAKNPGDGTQNWPAYKVLDMSAANWCWSSRMEVADLNGDGKPDIIAGGECNSTIWIQQPAIPTTTPWASSPTTTIWTPSGGSHTLAVGDLDRDGDIDVYIAEHKGNTAVRLYQNNGAGSFANFYQLYSGGGRDNHIGAMADMDGDGDLDFVNLSWETPDKIMLWRNDAIRDQSSSPLPPSNLRIIK